MQELTQQSAGRWVVDKLWVWVKKNPWKAVLFPLVLVGVILTWILSKDRPLRQVVSGTLDEDAGKALKAKDRAIQEYQQSLKKIEADAKAKLGRASKEQLEELEKVRKENPDGVAKWINELS